MARGITPPNALPSYFPPGHQTHIQDWYENNFFKLHHAGIQYLGTEPNLQHPDEFEKAKIRILIVRLAPYDVVDGSYGMFQVAEFCRQLKEDVFFDFCYFPYRDDLPKLIQNNIPLMFGTITKRPPTDFNIFAFSHSPINERIHMPFVLAKSGIPVFRWERLSPDLPYNKNDKCPLVLLAGIGAAFTENLCSDSPIHGPAGNAIYDISLVGEGEGPFTNFLNLYQKIIIEEGKTKAELFKSMTNQNAMGFYDPSRYLFKYHDKIHTEIKSDGSKTETVWEQGGGIKSIEAIDPDTNTIIPIITPDSEEVRDLTKIQQAWVENPPLLERS